MYTKALDRREYLKIIRDNFSYFSFKPYVATPHMNRLDRRFRLGVTTYVFVQN